MTGSPALNTMNAPKWAAVVSGTVWKRWGVSGAGLLEAEYVRGPLIIWAKPGSGEEEDAPKIEAPKPDALALRVVELNTARQWEKVGQAARWKVRASVRWKTRRRNQEGRALDTLAHFADLRRLRRPTLYGRGRIVSVRVSPESRLDLEARRITEESQRLVFEEGGAVTFEACVSPAVARRTAKRLLLPEHPARALASSLREYVEYLTDFLRGEKEPGPLLALALYTRDECAGRFAFVHARLMRSNRAYALLEFVSKVGRVARNTGASLRQKTAIRRTRPPRPTFAPSCPPSAPLAPPVTC